MTFEAAFTLGTLVLTVLLLASERIPAEVVAMLARKTTMLE